MNNELVLSLFELPCDIQLYYGTTVNSLKWWSTEYFKSIAPNFFFTNHTRILCVCFLHLLYCPLGCLICACHLSVHVAGVCVCDICPLVSSVYMDNVSALPHPPTSACSSSQCLCRRCPSASSSPGWTALWWASLPSSWCSSLPSSTLWVTAPLQVSFFIYLLINLLRMACVFVCKQTAD